jgi:hypothetical protein
VTGLWDAEKLKLSSDGGVSFSKNYKRIYVGAYGGVCLSLHLLGVWSRESGARFYVGVF